MLTNLMWEIFGYISCLVGTFAEEVSFLAKRLSFFASAALSSVADFFLTHLLEASKRVHNNKGRHFFIVMVVVDVRYVLIIFVPSLELM